MRSNKIRGLSSIAQSIWGRLFADTVFSPTVVLSEFLRSSVCEWCGRKKDFKYKPFRKGKNRCPKCGRRGVTFRDHIDHLAAQGNPVKLNYPGQRVRFQRSLHGKTKNT